MEFGYLRDLVEKPISGEWGDGEGTINVLRTTNFTNHGQINFDDLVKRNIQDKKVFDKKLLKEDIIIEKSGGSPAQPVGRVVFFNEEGTYLCNNFTSILRPLKKHVFPKYLHYILFCNHKFGFVRKFQNKTTGIINLQLPKYLKDTKIPLPSLTEQQKIAAILDAADSLRQKDQQLVERYTTLSQSLFLEMFGDPVTNPMGWEINRWNDILDIKNGKNQKAVEDLNGKYPIYGSGGNVMAYANQFICNENTVIIGRKGNINKPILIKEKFWNVDTAFGLQAKPEKLSYLYLYWFCVFFNFETLNKTVTIPSLTKSDLLRITIPLPPVSLQNQFAESIKLIEAQKQQAQASLQKSEALFNSLLQQAFTGALTAKTAD